MMRESIPSLSFCSISTDVVAPMAQICIMHSLSPHPFLHAFSNFCGEWKKEALPKQLKDPIVVIEKFKQVYMSVKSHNKQNWNLDE
jgi:hypothetical protein